MTTPMGRQSPAAASGGMRKGLEGQAFTPGREARETNATVIPRAGGRLARLKARRRAWLKVHLWLGLALGAVLAVVGLTGSVLVFWQEIDTWLNPELRIVPSSPGAEAVYRPLDELVAAAAARFPPGTGAGLAEFRRGTPDAAVMFFGRERDKPPAEADVYNVFVDPYTARVLGTRKFYDANNPLRHCLMGFVFKLHYALLMKDTARTFLGIVGAFLILSVLTGLILWWPLTGRWRMALTLKRGASFERLNFDLHKTAGFYSAAVLLAVLFSGVYLNLPEQVTTLVRVFSPGTRNEVPVSSPGPERPHISPGQALAAVEAAYPGGSLASVVIPKSAAEAYRVCHGEAPDLEGRFIRDRCVTVDPYDARLLHVVDVIHGTRGDAFLQWQWHLHSGQAFGWTGRILVFISGLACPLLFATGVIRWLQKRRAR